MQFPRLMITAPGSGSGKTMITCGLLQAFKNRGLSVSAFKCGPDYIDPMFHQKAIEIPSRNLDLFLMGKEGVYNTFYQNAGRDISLIEGVMGYYDGLGGMKTTSGSYDLCQTLSAKAVLVVNAKGMSLSVIALIKGFLEYKANNGIQGIILNRINQSIYEKLKKQIEQELPVTVYGYLPDKLNFNVTSRHLGLVEPAQLDNIKEMLQELALQIEQTVDVVGLLKLAEQSEEFVYQPQKKVCTEEKCKIAVAKDEAFSFYYEDNLEFLRSMGCKIEYFSPMADKKLPQGINGLILGGGYPELYAKQLSENEEMRKSIHTAVADGLPMIAECGGFLYLHSLLEDDKGQFWAMADIIKGKAFHTHRLVHFGYCMLQAQKDSLLWNKGEQFPAHEFHYWDSDSNGNAFIAQKPYSSTKAWSCVHMGGKNTYYAGFPHIHFYGCPSIGKKFVELCRKGR